MLLCFLHFTDTETTSSVIREPFDDTVPDSKTSLACYSNHSANNSVPKTYAENSPTASDADYIVSSSVAQNGVKKSKVKGLRCLRMDDSSLNNSHLECRPETNKQLGTLLLYKDLKTTGRYEVQFSDGTDPHHRGRRDSAMRLPSRASSSSSFDPLLPKQEPAEDSPRTKRNGETCGATENLEPTDDSQSDDCEVTFQTKVIEDEIYFKHANQLDWRLLTEESLANLKTFPIREPKKEQTIAFQVLYCNLIIIIG